MYTSLLIIPFLAVLSTYFYSFSEWYYFFTNPLDYLFPLDSHSPVNWTSTHTASPAAKQKLPNIILILADDLGYNDISFYNSQTHKLVSTPNIDSIGKLGVSFTNAYSGNNP